MSFFYTDKEVCYIYYQISLTNPCWIESDLISSLGSTEATLNIQTQCGHSAPSGPPNCEQPTGRPRHNAQRTHSAHATALASTLRSCAGWKSTTILPTDLSQTCFLHFGVLGADTTVAKAIKIQDTPYYYHTPPPGLAFPSALL